MAEAGAEGLSSDPRLKLNFSFLKANADAKRAERDLILVVDTLAARPELDAAYQAATARLETEFDETNFAEQIRLKAEIEELDQRLTRLVLGDETD